jgi:hypothetical protein
VTKILPIFDPSNVFDLIANTVSLSRRGAKLKQYDIPSPNSSEKLLK